MDALLALIPKHGYALLFAAVFLEAVGIPIPAALALLIAGGAAAAGSLNPLAALGGAFAAMLLADSGMFFLGRLTGWWMLGLLCRLSLNPESCILRSADAFYRRGRTLLLFAKFIPGINTMAPPLAGSMNMPLRQFWLFDLGGVLFYVGAYFSIGYAFSGFLESILKGYRSFSHVITIALFAAVLIYVLFQAWMWRKSLKGRFRLYVSPVEAYRASSADIAVIYDVRSHGYYDRKAVRIAGSKRLDPNLLHHTPLDFDARKRIYLYCTCVKEATSGRVAQELREKGTICAVIEGGLRAWRKAGLPVELVPAAELTALPVFGR